MTIQNEQRTLCVCVCVDVCVNIYIYIYIHIYIYMILHVHDKNSLAVKDALSRLYYKTCFKMGKITNILSSNTAGTCRLTVTITATVP